jgi:hypothetical protein
LKRRCIRDLVAKQYHDLLQIQACLEQSGRAWSMKSGVESRVHKDLGVAQLPLKHVVVAPVALVLYGAVL